jgi:Gpi18-like mannosyltransferase/4-amino-4-deoxy-L-arabinose transferase-like glycosyltransferase
MDKRMSFFRRRRLPLILGSGFLIRLALAGHGTYWRDLNTFIAWSHRLQEGGLQSFYQGWSDYLPGYLYVLWAWGWIGRYLPIVARSQVFYKLPAILADLATTALIYRLISSWRTERLAAIFSLLYLYNPAVLANSTFWGQVDAVNSLFYILAIFAAARDRFWQTVAWASISLLIKPQGVVILPLLLLPYIKRRRWRLAAALPFLVALASLVSFYPFMPAGSSLPIFAWERFRLTLNQYHYTSLNAFNLWAALGLMWFSDAAKIGPFSMQLGGLILFASVFALVIGFLGKRLSSRLTMDKAVAALAALIFLSLFLLPTRVHERHLFSALPFLILTAAYWPIFRPAYVFFSCAYVLNLLFAYVWLTQGFRTLFSPRLVGLFSQLNLAVWLILLFRAYRDRNQDQRPPDHPRRQLSSPPDEHVVSGLVLARRSGRRRLLLLLVLFALGSRLFRIDYPRQFYFDEVYHAFTATEMVKGNPAAWEWWNPPPEGVAYEWTHPPLAKEFMAAGILIFGEHPWAWRLPGVILGTLNLWLIFLIGRELFPGTRVGIGAAFLYTVDFLPFVQSRIGMNDVYFLFFQLLSFWVFIKIVRRFSLRRLLLATAAWGAALAAKWSALYGLVPILWLVASGAVYRRAGLKKRFAYSSLALTLAGLIFVPVAVYLFSYTPFFTSGHTISQFVELQKQMWWYHTRLKATHPYASPWWSWPMDLRPVWYFVEYQTDRVANIYAFGNPFVWWFGMLSMTLVMYGLLRFYLGHGLWETAVSPARNLVFVVVGYLSFFLPWSLSPRIMFIYHYLPSLPFLYLGTSWALILLSQKYRLGKYLAAGILLVSFLSFIFFYPQLVGLPLPRNLDRFYFWLPGWR